MKAYRIAWIAVLLRNRAECLVTVTFGNLVRPISGQSQRLKAVDINMRLFLSLFTQTIPRQVIVVVLRHYVSTMGELAEGAVL